MKNYYGTNAKSQRGQYRNRARVDAWDKLGDKLGPVREIAAPQIGVAGFQMGRANESGTSSTSFTSQRGSSRLFGDAAPLPASRGGSRPAFQPMNASAAEQPAPSLFGGGSAFQPTNASAPKPPAPPLFGGGPAFQPSGKSRAPEQPAPPLFGGDPQFATNPPGSNYGATQQRGSYVPSASVKRPVRERAPPPAQLEQPSAASGTFTHQKQTFSLADYENAAKDPYVKSKISSDSQGKRSR